ncbi:hypothetical protein MD535_06270 [Vibrio sp. ZSDZ65]|uniref:Uncharacterized protein n=1 Tax=Vibrio qingdaonensis TaxID=2829491 RepID=A0A9X3CLI1_9VIBR|nr:hypothetical protein [Vibrio qingdaonensis]MCW8345613.1 hypothetical protein [Vibrio qingdaonensis]
MNGDSSNYELIDKTNALFRLDFDFKNYDLVLSRDDLLNLEKLGSKEKKVFISKKGIEFEELEDSVSFSYSVPNGKRLDVYPSLPKFNALISGALSKMGY